MISNERQYRITKARTQELEEALLSARSAPSGDELWEKIKTDAIEGQLEDLRREIQEYESLRARGPHAISVDAIDQLPRALVQARIASGLTQKDLAAKLDLKEQQIQRYEATNYSTASLEKIKEVADALGLHLAEGVLLPTKDISEQTFLTRTRELGLTDEFVMKRLVPPAFGRSQTDPLTHVLQAAARIRRVFDIPTSMLLSHEQIRLSSPVLAATRFKLPKRNNRARIEAYTLYAHYLALLVLQCVRAGEVLEIPDDPKAVYLRIMSDFGAFTFSNCLQYVWNLGIPVLPLRDPGGFHAACWRINGRNIIALKQSPAITARWIVDLLHELKHASQNPEDPNFAIVEETDLAEQDDNQDDAELDATDFGVDIALGGDAEAVAQQCVKASKGRVELLKSVVPSVAQRNNVRADVLANYLAFRLSEENTNWWGTAQALQDASEDPFLVARDLLLRNLNLAVLNPVDSELLLQALSDVFEE